MGTWSPISWACLGCWLWILHACAALGPTSVVPEDEFTPGAGSPTEEGSLLRAGVLAATETAVTSAARLLPSLSDMAANPDVTTLPGESTISSGHASEASASFPTEVATASLVSAVNGDNVNSVPETVSSLLEPVASSSEAGEIPIEEAETSASVTNSLHASPENRTVAMTPAGEAVARLALFFSSPTDAHPTRFSRSELEVTGSVPGTFSGVTTSSPLSAAPEDERATPGTGGGPEDLASTGTVVPNGTPPCSSVGEVESTPAAFLSPAASPTEDPVSETKSPGHDGSSAPKSPEPPSESETSALAEETSPPASVAGWEEAGSLGPAETEGEGLSPSAFPSITGSEHLASESKTVSAPAAPEGRGDTGKSMSDTNEETPISAIDTQSQINPSPADAEQRLANTEELPTGDPGALSNAETSPRSFLELGMVRAISTAPSAVPSPRDIPAEPSVSESESTGSSSAGLSGAPSSPQPLPDAAIGTAPVATGAGEELANSANASVRGTPLAPSVLESASPAATAKGPVGANVSGGFASGVAAPSNVELAATTSHAGTRSETDPSPRGVEPSPAPMDNLPTGEPRALAVDSPQPPSTHETALAQAPAENRGDMAILVPAVHGETPISNPNLQSATNPSPAVPEQSPGDAAEMPAGETEALASAEASPHVPLGDRTVTGRLAPLGGTSQPAFVAGWEEAGSLGPAETEGEGLSPSAFPSITGSKHPASESKTVSAPAAPEGREDTGKSVSDTNEETPISAIDTQSQTNPSPADAEQRLANTEELPTGDPGALSNAETSPPSFLEPGMVRAISTAPSAVPSPRDIPAEPSVSESESTGSSSAGLSGAPSSPQPLPDAAIGTAPVATGAGEELANSANASVRGTPLAPSVLESASPAATAKGPVGANVSGGFASGVAAPSNVELAATTSHAGTRSETDPSPRGAEPSPAPMDNLPTGEPRALAVDSPQPPSTHETALAQAPAENRGDMAILVPAVHGETPISNPNLQSATNPSPAVPEQSPGDAAELPAGETEALASAEASPHVPLGDRTVTGRLAPLGGTSQPAFASPSGALAEPKTMGDATNGLSGAFGAPLPAPARKTSAGSEGTSASIFVVPGDPASVPAISDSPGRPSTVGSAPPSSAGERVTIPPVAIEGRGDAAGSVSAANEETTTSNPDAQHAEASRAGGAELPPGERDAWVNAETSPYSSLGDARVTGIQTPSGETPPPAFASPGETAAGPSASETAWPGPSFPSAPVPSPSSPERPTVIGPAGVAKEAAISAGDSGVPAAFPALEPVTGQLLKMLRLATSVTPAATGSHSPSLHLEKGKTPPEPGVNLGLAGVSHVPAASTPAPSRGRAATPFPPLGTTALRSDTKAGFVQERTASVSAGTREATTSGTGQSATVAAVPLYPYGAKESDKQYVERRVDFNSCVFKPEIGFPFGKTLRDSLYFTDNGQIIFPASDSDMFPSPNPPPGGFTGREKVPVVAVFWANADFSKGVGSTFYQEFVTLDSAKHPFVQDVETKIRRYLKTSYSAKWTLKITWEKAPAYPAWKPVTRTNTYQAVLTTDGIKSYVLILYQDGGMQWDYTKLGLTSVLIGYSSGDGFYRNDDLTRRPPAANYRPDQFRGYNTGLANTRVTMLYPASPNQYGAGVRCLYNRQNELVDGRQERSWKKLRQVSPDHDAELKLHDWCCRRAGSPQLCAKYSQKRPKISCAGHRLPNQTTSSEETASASEEGRD